MSFASFASTWSSPEGEMALLHRMQVARREFMHQHLTLPGLKGLDVGCGGGINTIDLATQGCVMTGIDCEQALIDVAQEQAQEKHLIVQWHATSIEDFQPAELYDFICCYEVLEHLPNPALCCEKMLSWLKPGGLIFCSTINKTPQAYATAVLLGEYLLRYLPIGTHDFEQFIPHHQLHQMLQPAQCRDLRGMIYNPLEKKFFLGESLGVQYIGVWHKESA